jgi:hypothetical protein
MATEARQALLMQLNRNGAQEIEDAITEGVSLVTQ